MEELKEDLRKAVYEALSDNYEIMSQDYDDVAEKLAIMLITENYLNVND
jgi:uncharacterized Zn finger protein